MRVLKGQAVSLLLVSWDWTLYNLPHQKGTFTYLLSSGFFQRRMYLLNWKVKSLTVRAEFLSNNQREPKEGDNLVATSRVWFLVSCNFRGISSSLTMK